MPQLSLLHDHPAMTAMSVEVTPLPPEAGPGWNVHVRVATGTQPPKSRWVGALVALEVDYLDTLVERAVYAFQHLETPRDVVRACAEVKRLARRYAATHGL